jgi:hypothetical protein
LCGAWAAASCACKFQHISHASRDLLLGIDRDVAIALRGIASPRSVGSRRSIGMRASMRARISAGVASRTISFTSRRSFSSRSKRGTNSSAANTNAVAPMRIGHGNGLCDGVTAGNAASGACAVTAFTNEVPHRRSRRAPDAGSKMRIDSGGRSSNPERSGKIR